MIYKLYFNITIQKKKKISPRQSLFSRHVLVFSILEDSWLSPAFEASLLLSCLESLSLSLKKKIEISFSFDSQLCSLA